MSCRNYFWFIIILFSSCAALLQRSDFKRGLEFYREGDFLRASEHFNSYYFEHPQSETTLYYLYDCYQRLNQPERGLAILQQFVKIGSNDENVYLNLFFYYHKNHQYRDLYKLLIDLNPAPRERIDKQCSLTRQLYAELIYGASEKLKRYSDPMVFAVGEGYLTLFPDSAFYKNDTITQANLIILLDHFVKPIYPRKFFKMNNLTNGSFLYLPYMRLVDLGILDFNPDLNPNAEAAISMVVMAVENLRKKGLIE